MLPLKSLLCIALLTSTATSAQDLPPMASAVRVITPLSFQEVCSRLLDSGFVIERRDAELQTVRTEMRRYAKHWNAAYRLDIRQKDSVVTITPLFTAPYEAALTGRAAAFQFKEEPVMGTNKKGKAMPISLGGYPYWQTVRWAACLGPVVQHLGQQ